VRDRHSSLGVFADYGVVDSDLAERPITMPVAARISGRFDSVVARYRNGTSIKDRGSEQYQDTRV
jgi:hypothetical protein